MKTFTLRKGCEPPVQPATPAKAQHHLRYSEYLRYRAALSAQLVTAAPFDSWINQIESACL